MRTMAVAALLFLVVDTKAQTALDRQFPQKPEQIIAMPYGGYAHDKSTSKPKKRADETSPALTPASPSWIPHPILFMGPSFVGNGYQTIAGSIGGGLMVNSKRLLSNSAGRYMNVRKPDDNNLNNRKSDQGFLE